jgi:hypothetical protein
MSANNPDEITRRMGELSGEISGYLQRRMTDATSAGRAQQEMFAAATVVGALAEALRRQLPPELVPAVDTQIRQWMGQTPAAPASTLRPANGTNGAHATHDPVKVAQLAIEAASAAYEARQRDGGSDAEWAETERQLATALQLVDACPGQLGDADEARQWLGDMLATVRARRAQGQPSA